MSTENPELIDSTSTSIPHKKITLKDILISEVNVHVEQSTLYKEKIDSAKTSTKANYYVKKLKKNNMSLMSLLVALDNLDKSKEK